MSKPLNRFIKIDFICDKCQRKFERAIVYSLAPNLDQLNDYSHYCVNCKEKPKKNLYPLKTTTETKSKKKFRGSSPRS